MAACDSAADKHADMCARVVPALHQDEAPADILTVEHEPTRHAVHITYRLQAGGEAGRLRWIRCTFSTDASVVGGPHLDAVETDIGSVGEGRLFVIRRWWLDAADASPMFGDSGGRSTL
ncbi:MAG: hypothetical protein ACR2PM_05315 [Hyphomicrobiales bacterium]